MRRVPFSLETAVNIAYACRLFKDEMDGVFMVEGTDRESVLQELRYTQEHSLSLDPSFPLPCPQMWSPPQKGQKRNEERETDRIPKRVEIMV